MELNLLLKLVGALFLAAGLIYVGRCSGKEVKTSDIIFATLWCVIGALGLLFGHILIPLYMW